MSCGEKVNGIRNGKKIIKIVIKCLKLLTARGEREREREREIKSWGKKYKNGSVNIIHLEIAINVTNCE